MSVEKKKYYLLTINKCIYEQCHSDCYGGLVDKAIYYEEHIVETLDSNASWNKYKIIKDLCHDGADSCCKKRKQDGRHIRVPHSSILSLMEIEADEYKDWGIK